MSVDIATVRTSSDLREFIEVPYRIMAHDPCFVPPLRIERKAALGKRNPFFAHGEAEYLLARRGDRVVGRISAHINRLHDERYQDNTGFFGFFDCEPDAETARALVDAAAARLAARGRTAMRGPFNFTINDECGVLVEGFDTPPYLMMTHNPPYYDSLLQGAGLNKARDLFAWQYDATRPVPDITAQIADAVRQTPGLTLRKVTRSTLVADMPKIVEVFNDAWSKNWGFVPMTDREMQALAAELKWVFEPELALIAEVDGQVAAISLALPNLNEFFGDLDGRLLPFNWARLLTRLVFRRPRTARLALLGVKKEFRSIAMGGLSVLLYAEMHRRGAAIGVIGGELSWTLEDNERINHGIELMGGTVYKKYRIYDKTLA